MKLRELRPILRAARVDLLLEVAKPIRFEIFDVDHKGLAEYRQVNDVDERENDTMFRDYGDCEIEAVYTDKENENEIINIDLKNVG